jgi:hypothetical protein
MTTLLQARRIRLAADAGKKTSEKIKDVFTGGTPELWRGNDVRFEIGLFLDSTILSDISNIATLTLEVKDAADKTGAPLMTKTLTSGDLTACLDADWTAKTGQHGVIEFTGTESNIPVASYWLVISATTTDSPGKSITIGATDFSIVEDGAGSAGSPATYENNVYTKGESDGRFVQKHADQAWFQDHNGTLRIYEASTDKWYGVVVTISGGVPTITLDAGETL